MEGGVGDEFVGGGGGGQGMPGKNVPGQRGRGACGERVMAVGLRDIYVYTWLGMAYRVGVH